MISTTWTTAASDLLVRGGVDVRERGPVMAASAAPIQGTGLPLAACTGGAVATGLIGSTAGRRRTSLRIVERFLAPTYLPQNDNTTLGLPAPGRSLS
ncbi:hypothetical protein [Blastococcus xanthinilyticus]|uniref:Uncharacterized protein n=1 Tax=Blastococcus xanthinilyticus TaxID=1564164 RepID=A0A5S5D1Q7_9ACTN|nr:hypothetical protein [Blastococcus xanthinilyticus]TYP89950.1 hypothetical protein BD833_102427 [Blastococcus xanthinilyticus]